jgi:hypothetical protein
MTIASAKVRSLITTLASVWKPRAPVLPLTVARPSSVAMKLQAR